jgi:hypothetical protein
MNIATHANRSTKVKKARLIMRLRDAYDVTTDPLILDALAQAYKHLSPTPTAAAAKKHNFTWVALASRPDDIREPLRYVHCDGSRIMATDGHRLHIVPNDEGLAKGFYDRNKQRVEDVSFRFPDIDRVLPKTDGVEPVIVDPERVAISDDGISADLGGVHINLKYFKHAVAGHGGGQWYLRGPLDSAVLKSGSRTAVIMPIRI